MLSVNESRRELSIKAKNGIGFLLSGSIIWGIVSIIFLQSIETYDKNIYMLVATGLMFPLSIGICKLIKAEWRSLDNPLGDLGLYLNLAQLMYFPMLVWAIGKNPDEAVMVLAIITGAHFFPYGWFYNAKPYYFMSPITSVIIMIIGYNIDGDHLWIIPVAMVILLLLLALFLFIDFKNKSR